VTIAPALDPALQLALRGALAALLGAAAVHKMRNPAAFRAALADYRVLPARAVPAVAAALPGVELLMAALLLTPAGAPAALAAGGLLSLYTAGIAWNLARGRRDVDCGCFGPARRRPLSGGLVARNALLVAASALASGPRAPRALVWLDGVTIAAGVAVLALLYAAIDGALAHAPRSRALRGGAWSTR